MCGGGGGGGGQKENMGVRKCKRLVKSRSKSQNKKKKTRDVGNLEKENNKRGDQNWQLLPLIM